MSAKCLNGLMHRSKKCSRFDTPLRIFLIQLIHEAAVNLASRTRLYSHRRRSGDYKRRRE
jgi:hypothetical protein